jgi:hypothetical protein
MKKQIRSIAAATLCGIVLSLQPLPTAHAQDWPDIVHMWTAGSVSNVQVVSGDARAAAACTQLFSGSIHAYWEDGRYTILGTPGPFLILCPPEQVIWEPGEGTLRIQGQFSDGLYAGTVLTGKAIKRDNHWWDMEIYAVKEEPTTGSSGTAPAFEVTFELALEVFL